MVENSSNVLAADERALWKPTTGSSTLVLTIPPTPLLKEKDRFIVYVYKDGKIVAEPINRGSQEIARE